MMWRVQVYSIEVRCSCLSEPAAGRRPFACIDIGSAQSDRP